MEFHDEEISEIVQELIRTGREDDYWDFKECHHTDKAALLHDIICLANNRANRDAYLIFGIRDKTYEVIGVENDPKRKDQQMIVDFLSGKNFAGQIRPRVEVRIITLENHQIDVFIIKNSTDVPYYLIESYSDKKYKPEPPKKGKTVQAFYIYTRIMDNNTPINKSADLRDVEYLWKKRFGLLQTPLDQIKVLLKSPDDWKNENSQYYHKLFPQYTIAITYDDCEDGSLRVDTQEFYHYLQYDSSAYYGMLKVYHYNTQLFSCQVTDLDGRRVTVPCPTRGTIKWGNGYRDTIYFKYYLKTDLQYILLCFLQMKLDADNGGEASIATRTLLEAVLLFEDEREVKSFEHYVSQHLQHFNELVSQQTIIEIADQPEHIRKEMAKRICDSYALKIMENEWRAGLKV